MCILVKSRQKSSSGKWQKRHIVASGGKGVITSGGKELRDKTLHKLAQKCFSPLFC